MNIGTIVHLNSNPELLMTVAYVCGEEPNGMQEKLFSQQMKILGYEKGDVYCTWFEGQTLKNAPFKAKMLTITESK